MADLRKTCQLAFNHLMAFRKQFNLPDLHVKCFCYALACSHFNNVCFFRCLVSSAVQTTQLLPTKRRAIGKK
ncbi:hypothetical protein T08_9030 [Trichinella sp. T8]|nr:hypothetical protein T08_9030 [Trichinella sp. T8]